MLRKTPTVHVRGNLRTTLIGGHYIRPGPSRILLRSPGSCLLLASGRRANVRS
jgi:hypothetical protein